METRIISYDGETAIAEKVETVTVIKSDVSARMEENAARRSDLEMQKAAIECEIEQLAAEAARLGGLSDIIRLAEETMKNTSVAEEPSYTATGATSNVATDAAADTQAEG